MRNVRVPVPAELELGVQKKDTIEIRRVDTWLSRDGFEAEADAQCTAADDEYRRDGVIGLGCAGAAGVGLVQEE